MAQFGKRNGLLKPNRSRHCFANISSMLTRIDTIRLPFVSVSWMLVLRESLAKCGMRWSSPTLNVSRVRRSVTSWPCSHSRRRNFEEHRRNPGRSRRVSSLTRLAHRLCDESAHQTSTQTMTVATRVAFGRAKRRVRRECQWLDRRRRPYRCRNIATCHPSSGRTRRRRSAPPWRRG